MDKRNLIIFILSIFIIGCVQEIEPQIEQPILEEVPPVEEKPVLETPPLSSNTEIKTQWITIDAPNNKIIKAFIAQPGDDKPHAAVIILHGTDGFRSVYTKTAEVFAKHGFIAVAGCWFAGSYFKGRTFDDSIACPEGPEFKGANLEALKDVTAIIDHAGELFQPEHIALWGQSRGATMAVLAASSGMDIDAAVANGAIYTTSKQGASEWPYTDTLPITMVESLSAPLLMIHGTADAIVNIQEAYDYEAAAKKLEKDVSTHYYEGGSHGVALIPPTAEDARERAMIFLKENLG